MKAKNLRFGGALVMAGTLALATTTVLTTAQGKGLSSRGRELVAAARVARDATVTLVIATAPRDTVSVTQALARLGATVRYQADELGYIRAIVPIDQAEFAAALPGVQAADADEMIRLPDPRPYAGQAAGASSPGVAMPPLALNPYLPSQDIGAPQFVQLHPTFDGRGVTIGIVDTGIDLLTPELQTGMLLDGTLTPKIADWVSFTDPLTDNDPSWINMAMQVRATPKFSVEGTTYTAPAVGTYRFGIFKEADVGTGSEFGPDYGARCNGADVNRNGICDELFAVLWRTADNTVWVDSDTDHNFADEKPMTDYKVRHDVGVFGVDNVSTAVRESVPFVVQTDSKDKFVNIGIVSAAHGTHVAGIAAGKGFFGGLFDGVAPEARIVSVRACKFNGWCTSHGMLEGVIFAAKQSNADVVNMSLGMLTALNDANTAWAMLYTRLIDQTKAQLFFSAGNNGPGINTAHDTGATMGVMSVGASVTQQTYWADFGTYVPRSEGMFGFSSRGPSEDGRLKPDIVAPGAAVSSLVGWQLSYYGWPAGYDMFFGTSMSAPQATGGAALLISAAKQTGVQYRPAQLRQAINSSARFLQGYSAHEQGNGVINVGAAWSLLSGNIKTEEITSVAPVNTMLKDYLAIPGAGQGIYEREGWVPGQAGTRTITFLRTEGGVRAETYDLLWAGNDGTFAATGTSIALPLNVPVDLAITVNAATVGAHSALLKLRDRTTGSDAYQVLNTVVAVPPFTAANNYTLSYSSQVARADTVSYFFYVPPGTSSYRFDMTGLAGIARITIYDPYGLPYASTDYLTNASAVGATFFKPASGAWVGVWEAIVDVSPYSAMATTFTVAVKLPAAN